MLGNVGYRNFPIAFSPAALFAAAEPGVWYDPSDLTTLFQDSAGTTPVTAPAQPVGRMLDKSQGLVLGSELRGSGTVATLGSPGTLGTYNTSTGAGSAYRLDGSNASGVQISPTQDRTYVIDVEQLTGTLQIRGTTLTGTQLVASVTGRQTFRVFLPSGSYLYFTSGANASGTTFTVHSVKLLPGNHATQSTSASRPTYGIVPATGRRNLLLNTGFAGAVAGTPGIAPTSWALLNNTGSLAVADSQALIFSAVGGREVIIQTLSVLADTTYVFSVKVLSSSIQMQQTVTFNPTPSGSSVLGPYVNGVLKGMTYIPNAGETLVYVISVAATAGSLTVRLGAGTSSNLTGAVTLATPQLETGSTATAYQKVVSAFEVTEANVASLSYLSFDGIDDFMITPTITPGTDKVQVFAGVRKLSDAANAAFIEWSTGYNANNGSFVFFTSTDTSGVTGAFYRFGSRGSAALVADQQALASGYAAPITNVVSATADISGDLTTIRVNSIAATNGTGDQGTGNYLAYPMYIGRRAGTSLPFNGQMYGLITRFGSNLTTTAISRTESWMNSKTGAY